MSRTLFLFWTLVVFLPTTVFSKSTLIDDSEITYLDEELVPRDYVDPNFHGWKSPPVYPPKKPKIGRLTLKNVDGEARAADCQKHLDMEPSTIVNKCVSIISGCYLDSDLDFSIPGAEPFAMHRHFMGDTDLKGVLGRGWHHNYFGKINRWKNKKHGVAGKYRASVLEGGGALYQYAAKEKYHYKMLRSAYRDAVTNCGSGTMSARTNIRNNILTHIQKADECHFYRGSGDLLTFSPKKDHQSWQLSLEQKPNGNQLRYSYYESGKLGKLEALNKNGDVLGVLEFKYGKTHNKHCIFVSHCGQEKAIYHLKGIRQDEVYAESHAKHYYLSEVHRGDGPRVDYFYNRESMNLIRKAKPNNRFLNISYYRKGKNHVGEDLIKVKERSSIDFGRVMTLEAPVGHDASPIITHRFFYSVGHTDVRDAYNHRTLYEIDDHERLSKLKRYKGTSHHQLYSLEELYWGGVYSSECTYLLTRVFKDAQNNIQFARTFSYDHVGNVLSDTLFGNLSGQNHASCLVAKDGTVSDNGSESYTKLFTYYDDDLHLLASEEEGKIKQTFHYKEGTDLLIAKLYSTEGKIFKREFYDYDENAVVIEEIEDDGISPLKDCLDGVTERRFRYTTSRKLVPVGLPEVVLEKYLDLETGMEKLFKKTVNHYNDQGFLLARDLYDANDCFLCTLRWEYDERGHITKEADAMGYETVRRYDENGNKVFERSPDLTVHKEFTYDFSDRLIRIDEIHANGLRLTEWFSYDYLGNKISSTDIYGNETRYVYDDFNRLIKTIYPAVADERGHAVQYSEGREYNIFNVPSKIIDPQGHVTYTEYNIRNQPIRTVFPDGSVETIVYNSDGTILEKCHKNGSRTHYQYDHLKRMTEQRTVDRDGKELESTQYVYNTFHLISEIDAAGHAKNYRYDGAGRLIEMTKGQNRTTYAYDSAGRLCKTAEHDGQDVCFSLIQTFDLNDRVLEERREDREGNWQTKVSYTYDHKNDRIAVSNHTNKETFTTYTLYDGRHQPIEITDASGAKTHIVYHYDYRNELGKIVAHNVRTDAMGKSTEMTADALGRTVSTVLKNSFGQFIHRTKTIYDPKGNKCLRVDHPSNLSGKKHHPLITAWSYDSMNRLVALTEAKGRFEQKQTEFLYNSYGEQSEIIKPDGTRIHHQYDALGRLKTVNSSDDSLHYHYAYDELGNIVSVDDLLAGQTTLREYDTEGRLSSETLGNSLCIKYQYDGMNRPTLLTFPDGTASENAYQGHQLKEIHRLSATGEKQYTHRYLTYDLEDKLTHAQLIGNAGEIYYQHDQVGRPLSIQNKAWQETIAQYDFAGNILQRTVVHADKKISYAYCYDDLYQITKEEGPESHTYLLNSRYNRTVKDGLTSSFNDLNQLLHDGEAHYTYDPNGNLIQKRNDEETIDYKYDAFNRLVEVICPENRINYTYDAQNRRLTKRTQRKKDDQWISGATIHYLYAGQNEIGSYDDNHAPLELRILGISKGAEIGAAIALELQGRVYAPIHDHNGNVAALIDAKTGSPVEFYLYTAFGEEQILDADGNALEESINPWRFSSKRTDPETGFVYFGRRYYDPAIGRWITPDPIGHKGGPNLYAYVFNRGLNQIDEYGLFLSVSSIGNFFIDCAGATFRTVGSLVNFLAYELVPVPIARDALQIGGRAMAGQGFEDFHFTFSSPCARGDLGLPEINPYQRVLLVGGIHTSQEDMIKRAEALSTKLGGANVHYYSAPSDGIVLDLIKAGARRIGCLLPSDRNYADMVSSLCQEIGSGGLIHVQAHSQGGILTNNLLKQLQDGQSKQLNVYTFGTGKFLNSRKFYDAKNYVSRWDAIPLFSNPLDYTSAFVVPSKDIIFLKSHGLPIIDHMWNGNTYEESIDRADWKISKFLKAS